jgi:hypothetical protein
MCLKKPTCFISTLEVTDTLILGNHDHYLDVSENEYINFTVSNFRLCLTKANPSGCTNFLVPIYKENKVVYSLWGIDGSRGILNSWGWLG